jgi:predicted RNA-binding Zn ribbon-like protein
VSERRTADPDIDQPGARLPAPLPLRLVQSFINTNDIEAGRDALASSDGLRRWIRTHGFDEPRVTEDDVARVRSIREALRTFAMANTDRRRAPAATLATLTAEAARADLRVRFDPDRARLATARTGVDAVMGEILAVTSEAMSNGTWERMKACRSDACRWVFFDRSPNRSANWCAMTICGTREKARTYYRRMRAPKGTGVGAVRSRQDVAGGRRTRGRS